MMTINDDSAKEEWISKSQKKRDCDALQKIGEQLIKLKADELASISLPEELELAILEARKLKSHSALKRQRQYIGKIIRTCDSEDIATQLNKVLHKNDTNTAQFKRIERWRDRLLENDKVVLGEIIDVHPQLDRQHIHNLVRQADKEARENKPPGSARKLFKYLRDLESQDA